MTDFQYKRFRLNNKWLRSLVVTFILVLIVSPVFARIMLPAILSDNMVFQQNSKVKIWGWTTSRVEKIAVSGSWGNDTVSTKAVLGKWMLEIETPKAGGPYSVFVEGHEKLIIQNVLIGENWLCSGQSNMKMPMDSVSRGFLGVINYKEEIEKANQPKIRLFTVEIRVSDYPQDNCFGKWVECTPENVKDFSAVAYYYGKFLQEGIDAPVGLINSSWGGTNIENWMRKEITTSNPENIAELAKIRGRNNGSPRQPGSTYNAMIHPLVNFRIAGVIFYQGESNKWAPYHYKRIFPELVYNWRHEWGYQFPFYYVQITPDKRHNGYKSIILRESQRLSMKEISNSGMAVTIDILENEPGDYHQTHPRHKNEVGKRLSLWSLADTYGKNVIPSGPLFQSILVDQEKVTVSFKYADGLNAKGDKLKHFEIAGSDKHFYPAKASIKGNKVILFSDEVKNPVAVRMAFSDFKVPNLYNGVGLPTPSFRSDNWEVLVK